ncbi:phosphate ABC transporter substrate-binding protein PstS [Pseudonocardia sp.]|uniref:phosphate ABC transporter substrate-binding protein PstS n=1 Tax=Pseudonocardia sp. TaxID=60912 RepID=UPI00260FFBB6|nr:phosphate ABC transporter substrate-binding protein PstS [Pseudonocardia sp.]
MKTLRHSARARIAAVGLATSGALLLAGCGAANETAAPAGGDGDTELSGSIAGAGASSQAAAMQAWVAGFNSTNPGVQVNYDPIGSGGGREQFTAGGTDFGGSDAYLDEEELPAALERCGGNVLELPAYISPIAVAFNLEGVDTLNLQPQTIAAIFTQQITNWNDPAIAADNAGATLPDLPITVVHRSDESGTTENFQDYLAAVAPDTWTFEVSGDWPAEIQGEAAPQTAGVVQAIGAGNGTIGYADASQVGDLGTVAVGVGGEFVEYSPEAAAEVVSASPRVEGRPDGSFAIDIDYANAPAGTYPVVLVSYELACGTYSDQQTADLVKAFFSYVVSEEGQQAAADNAGSAPISDEQREQFQAAIDSISAGA